MKTLTIGWLNKCRCGNKSHTVKTARGNEIALWDDDAVKCNSCGRGGVIQVCEGQARALWETDEEMVEGKPMSTITKERLLKIKQWRETYGPGSNVVLQAEEAEELARIALASLEAEAVCVIDQSNLDYLKSGSDADVWPASRTEMGDVLLYRAAPPAPVSVPDFDALRLLFEASERKSDHGFNLHKYGIGYADKETQARWEAWVACRAAMLQGAEPVSNRDELTDGWVACSERMPEKADEVLCAKEFDGPGDWRQKVGYYLAGKWTVYSASWTPTHWMPLPAAPQQEMK